MNTLKFSSQSARQYTQHMLKIRKYISVLENTFCSRTKTNHHVYQMQHCGKKTVAASIPEANMAIVSALQFSKRDESTTGQRSTNTMAATQQAHSSRGLALLVCLGGSRRLQRNTAGTRDSLELSLTNNTLHRLQLHVRKFSSRNTGTSVGSAKSMGTVEKQLLYLMDIWDVEAAVKLLRKSVDGGAVPHPNVVLDLQQQLANLGEVDCLLELHEFLKEHKLTSDTKFFHCLHEAYYNSGRIDEGVAVLRMLYHRTRKFSDVEIYFTLLAIMVLRHFPDHFHLIKGFVTDLKDAKEPVLEPGASLWKCFMMTKGWAEAEDLLLKNEELRPLLPKEVTRICQGVDKVEFDEVVVLTRLLDLDFIRQRLRVQVAETLIRRLEANKEWLRLLKFLKKMKTLALPLRANKINPVLDDLQRYLTPQYDKQIEEIRQWCNSLQDDIKQE